MKIKFLLWGGGGVIVAILLSLVLSLNNVDASSKKKLFVGTNAEYAPYESYDENDKLVGFDIELITALTKELDYEIKFLDMKFDGLIPALQTGKIDVLISAMSITPERLKKIDFSDEYNTKGEGSQSVLIVPVGGSIKNFEDLKGKNIGVETGSWQDEYAKKNFKDSKIIAYDGLTSIFLAFQTSKIDAILMGSSAGNKYATEKSNGKAVVLEEKIKMPGTAIGVKKGNKKLVAELNKALKKIQATGEYEKIRLKYFK
jgi:polar amino acid transport system substrate-binding protein